VHSAVDALVPCDASSPGRARRFVADVLQRHGLQTATDQVELLVSELVTNAIRHAASDATIAIDLDEDRIRVSVSDRGPGWPEPRDPDGRPGGYGLRFVDELADNWGTYRVGDGKTVWFQLDLAEHERST
jgi:anti-sigma regulatory factor (Ser/Thr protein kinase)